MKKNLFFALLLLVFASCEKLKHDNVIPEDAPRLTELQQQYKDLLVASPQGWYIEYAPSSDKGAVSILMQFTADGKVTILSDMGGFDAEKTSTYRIGGVTRPELIFDTYSVWSAIAENAGGSFEFLIYPQQNGDFLLKNIFQNTNLNFTLRKATNADKATIIAKSATTQLLKSFYDNATGYFKNMVLQNISAFFDLNINAQQLTLRWQQNGTVMSKTFSYANLPNGIRLTEAWKVGTISVQEIQFGAISGSTLQVVSAGNAGSGQIEVGHIPAFPYKGTADYFIQLNGDIRFYAYTLATVADYYSPALQTEYLKLKAVIGGETFLTQLYNHNGTAPNFTNSIQFRYIMPSGTTLHDGTASGWLPYYYNLTKMDESHVIITPTGTSNNAGAPFIAQVTEFMSYIFPPEGVTIVPYGRAGTLQRIRLVSRKDSKYYLTVTVSTPAGVYVD